MKSRARIGWQGQVVEAPVVTVYVDPGESLLVEPEDGMQAIVLIYPREQS